MMNHEEVSFELIERKEFRAMAVARAWVVVGEEFMRFVDDES